MKKRIILFFITFKWTSMKTWEEDQELPARWAAYVQRNVFWFIHDSQIISSSSTLSGTTQPRCCKHTQVRSVSVANSGRYCILQLLCPWTDCGRTSVTSQPTGVSDSPCHAASPHTPHTESSHPPPTHQNTTGDKFSEGREESWWTGDTSHLVIWVWVRPTAGAVKSKEVLTVFV